MGVFVSVGMWMWICVGRLSRCWYSYDIRSLIVLMSECFIFFDLLYVWLWLSEIENIVRMPHSHQTLNTLNSLSIKKYFLFYSFRRSPTDVECRMPVCMGISMFLSIYWQSVKLPTSIGNANSQHIQNHLCSVFGICSLCLYWFDF